MNKKKIIYLIFALSFLLVGCSSNDKTDKLSYDIHNINNKIDQIDNDINGIKLEIKKIKNNILQYKNTISSKKYNK
ncbi:MAG: murein lipoprotein [Candidatus Makana argininalis]